MTQKGTSRIRIDGAVETIGGLFCAGFTGVVKWMGRNGPGVTSPWVAVVRWDADGKLSLVDVTELRSMRLRLPKVAR